ncbi:KTSC domain-containing protein [Streptococcus danieliae]|uniref:KTSC domain-containing protein n=1 Tax=Streptococcus danieliae TaxID=747656 RepID=A0A7Z0LE80_9STRE|nr:KTSC domain-containing protein [Streptococcus danieliae]MBF0717783.1 KTSC domain-containing protein [Streptococcus danieliae]NYS49713.1 KTSC domain-containing protein [Streptococcus danieliae]
MKRHLVKDSRMIHSMGWEDGVMEVEYKTGLIHSYHDVTEDQFIRAGTGNTDKKVRLIGKSHSFTVSAQ